MGQQNPNMTNDKRDAETGRFASKHDRSDFVAALRALDGRAGTKAVAEEADVAYSTTDYYLRQLADEGEINREKVGNANLWVIDE